jgi:hypothetical protein
MPSESTVDASDWVALEWSEGQLELPSPRRGVRVTDVTRWGNGYVAVGHSGRGLDDRPGDGLIWLSADGLDWRLVWHDPSTFDGAEVCCVTRAREAFIAWTRDTGIFLSSVDGRTWTRTERQVDGYGLAVTETREGVFALTRGPFDYRALTTTDGVTWQTHETSGLHLVTAALFGRGGGQALVTRHGYFASGPPSQGGVHGGRYEWGSWYSPDGKTWREFKLHDDGPYRGSNARAYEEGSRFTFADEDLNTGAYIPDRSPWANNWRTEDGVDWRQGEPAGFPEVGRYDGHFTLDIGELFDGGPTRLSPDGVEIVELESRGAELRRQTADTYLHTAIGQNGIAVLADDGLGVWFGRAVSDSPTDKPAVYCGPYDAAMCLDLIRRVADAPTPEGSAFVVGRACIYFSCFDERAIIVNVPPTWPSSGGLRSWAHGPRTNAIERGAVPDHLRQRMPQHGPWADAVVGDRVWVHLGPLGGADARQVLDDHWLGGAFRPLAGWQDAQILDGYPAAAKLAQLRRDPRVCAVDFVRFDRSILSGEAASTPLAAPNASGCTSATEYLEFDLPASSHEEGGCTLVYFGAPTLRGSAVEDPPVWAAIGDDAITDIRWPPGYRAVFRPALEVLERSGRTVWREGDLVEPYHDELDVTTCYQGGPLWVFDPIRPDDN